MDEEGVEFVCMSEAGRVCVSVCVRVIKRERDRMRDRIY